jgi:5-methylcytosine-specific restriction endonuclease McrA
VASAKHVDHLFPWSWIGEQAFYRNIFQSLCHECHSHKTSLEQDGIIMHYTNPPKEYKLNDYALVMTMNENGMGAKEVKELKNS